MAQLTAILIASVVKVIFVLGPPRDGQRVQTSIAVMHSSARQSVPLLRTDPLLEPDRFFPAPSSHLHGVSDAQNAALTRLLQRCDQARPHLDTVAALSAWIERHEDPARVRRRISVVLALEQPDRERVYGLLMPGELEAFRRIARLKLPACVWVFS